MLYVQTFHQVSIPCLDTPTPPTSRPRRPALPSCPRRATSSRATPPTAEKVEAFLTSALDATGKDATAVARALVTCALGVTFTSESTFIPDRGEQRRTFLNVVVRCVVCGKRVCLDRAIYQSN
jgi:hypothetical protein